jgi:hypothetical protein
VDVSSDVVSNYATYQSLASEFSLSSVNSVIGKDIYGSARGYSSILLPGFGFSVLYDYQAAVRLKNQAFPQGQVGLINTYGGQFAFARPLLTLKKKNGELRFGIAGKALWRSGQTQSISLSQLMTGNTDTLLGVVTPVGMGYGIDLGLQFVFNAHKRLTLQAGAAWKDIGDTSFSSGAMPIKNNLTLGLSGTYSYGDLVATAAFDYAHVLDYAQWQKKAHLGLEFKLPFFSFYGGINQVSFTYGAGLSIAMLKLMYLSYGEDQATLVGQDTERRQMVQLAVKFDL